MMTFSKIFQDRTERERDTHTHTRVKKWEHMRVADGPIEKAEMGVYRKG